MNIIEPASIFTIRRDFCLSEQDEQVLSYLYLPILKKDAYTLYCLFYRQCSLMPLLGSTFHEEFLTLAGFRESDFLSAREKLEALGLLETYRKQDKEKCLYLYHLLPPASPKKFFKDVILRKLLQKEIGTKKYNLLSSFFRTASENYESFTPVTARFSDVFTLDNEQLDLEENGEGFQEKHYKQMTGFSMEELHSQLQARNYSLSAISKDESDMEDLLSLYGISPAVAADLVLNATDTDGHFYFDEFKSSVRTVQNYAPGKKKQDFSLSGAKSDAKAMKVLRELSNVTPNQYLSLYFNSKPQSFMLDEIEKLKEDFGFSNTMINVILNYSLIRTKGNFNQVFMEKVAASLSSQGVEDPYEAMVYLTKQDFEKAHVSRSSVPSNGKKPKKKDKDDVTKTDVDEILGEIDI